jgi:hypothetical protein
MERLLGYAGGPTALLMNGELVVTASGHNIVLLDLRKRDPTQPTIPSHKGLWKAFQNNDECDGYKQAFLKGHKSAIGVIEVNILTPFYLLISLLLSHYIHSFV